MLTTDLLHRLSKSPFISCNSPVKIYNKYLNMSMLVPCRHCSSCLDIKSSILSKRVEDECMQHVYSIFFTLTYDNEHVPYLIPHKLDNSHYSFTSSRGLTSSLFSEVNFDFPITSSEVHSMRPRSFNSDVIAVVSKLDIQNFLKRLRISILRKVFNNNKYSYNANGKIRYFISSEYGPNTYRPHYHGIIWTDSKNVAQFLLGSSFTSGFKFSSNSGISSAWKMCHYSKVFAECVNSAAPQYVSSYCNSYIGLPKILQTEFTRPFVVCSKNPIIGLSKDYDKEVSFCLTNGTNDLSKFEPSIFPDDRLPLQIFRKYFGLPKRCYQLSYSDLVLLYEKYEVVGRFSKPHDRKSTDLGYPFYDYIYSLSFNYSDYYFCKKVTKFCSSSHFYSHINNVNSISSFTAKFNYREVLFMIYHLIRAYSSYSNELFYSKLSFVNSFDCHWLSGYPNLLISLPLHAHDYDEIFDDFGLDDVTFSYLYNFNTLTNYYDLDTSFVHELLNYNHDTFKNTHALHIKHSNSTKIFNDV